MPNCSEAVKQRGRRATDPVTRAGPRALAGFMHMELTGPRIHMSRQIAKGTARGPSLPQPLQVTKKIKKIWQEGCPAYQTQLNGQPGSLDDCSVCPLGVGIQWM